MGKSTQETRQGPPDNWDDIEPIKAGVGEIVKWDEIGRVLIGQYRGKAMVDTDEGEVAAHSFTHPSGEAVAAWASYDLDNKLSDVPIGAWVRMEYVRDVPTKRGLNPMKSFKVQATL